MAHGGEELLWLQVINRAAGRVGDTRIESFGIKDTKSRRETSTRSDSETLVDEKRAVPVKRKRGHPIGLLLLCI